MDYHKLYNDMAIGRDGRIRCHDFERGLGELGYEIPHEEVFELFKRFQTQTGTVDVPKFKNMMKEFVKTHKLTAKAASYKLVGVQESDDEEDENA